jgi:hypothetical protein
MRKTDNRQDFRGDSRSCKIHLMGLKQMIMTQGGLETLKNFRRMQLLVVFISSSCNATYLPEAFDSAHSKAAEKEIVEHITQFKEFLRDVHKAASHLTTRIKISASSKSMAASFVHNRPIQHFLLKKDGSIYQLLAPSDEDYHRGGGGLGYLGTHRLACPFYICAALLHLRNEDDSVETMTSERYLQQTYNAILEHELDRRPNIRLFLFLLIRGPVEGIRQKIQLESSEGSWNLVRLMQVTKCLTWKPSMRVGQTLLNFLMMVEEPKESRSERTLDIEDTDWNIIDEEVWNRLR